MIPVPILTNIMSRRAGEWGYDGLEIACWGDHLDPWRTAEDDAYVQDRLDILERNGLSVYAISNRLRGQAVCDDPIDVSLKVLAVVVPLALRWWMT